MVEDESCGGVDGDAPGTSSIRVELRVTVKCESRFPPPPPLESDFGSTPMLVQVRCLGLNHVHIHVHDDGHCDCQDVLELPSCDGLEAGRVAVGNRFPLVA